MINTQTRESNGVKCIRSHSFDIGRFKIDYPRLAKIFIKVKTETITTETDILDKEGLKELYPKEFKNCQVENTASLRGL